MLAKQRSVVLCEIGLADIELDGQPEQAIQRGI
jgi:hypothetical protein